MKKILFLLAFLIVKSWVIAQIPANWTVNPGDFANSATMICKINKNCVDLSDNGNAVAAFVNGQCRGVAYTTIDVTSTGDKVAALTIYSNAVNGEVVYFEAYDDNSSSTFLGIDSILFVMDSAYGAPTMPFVITDNHPPFNLSISDSTVSENAALNDIVGTLLANDNGTPLVLNYSLPVGQLENDDYILSGTDVLVNKVLDYNLDPFDSLFVEVSDAMGCSTSDTIIIAIQEVQNAPVAVDDSVGTNEDTSILISILSNDSDLDNDLDTSSINIYHAPSIGAVAINSFGQLNYSPLPNVFGIDTLEYEICDMSSPVPQCDSAMVIISIASVIDAPMANLDFFTIVENIPADFYVLNNDFDGDGDLDTTSLSIIIPSDSGIASVNSDGSLNYIPNMGFNGLDTVIYEICDYTNPAALCDTSMLVIHVVPVLNPPLAVNDTISVSEDIQSAFNLLNNDSDPDNDLDVSSVTIINQPANGTASTDTTGVLSYLSNLNYNGEDSLSYVVFDQSFPTPQGDTAWVFITILPIADAPIAVNDSIQTNEDLLVSIDVLANDVDVENDLDASSLQLLTFPMNGTASVIGNMIDYSPSLAFNGQDSLSYVICDASMPNALCDTAKVYITVLPGASEPSDIYLDTLFLTEGNEPNFRIGRIYTIDADTGDSFFYELALGSGDEHNSFFTIVDDILYINSTANYHALQNYMIRISSTDSYGLSVEKEFEIEVKDVEGNEIPLPATPFISPNGDGINDYFTIANPEMYQDFELLIMDQFGFVIYQKENNYQNTWDGTRNGAILPSGNYYYVFKSETKTYTGNVAIVTH